MRSMFTLLLVTLLACCMVPMVTFASDPEAVKLEIKWIKGEISRQKLINTQKQTMTGVQNVTLAMTMEIVQRVEVLDVTDKGVATVKSEIESVRAVIDTAGQVVTYDSTLQEQEPLAEQFGLNVVGAMVKRGYTVDVDATGKVSKLHDDVKQFRAAVMEAAENSPNPAMRQQMEYSLSDEQLKLSYEQLNQYLPTSAVKPGEFWKHERDMSVPGGKAKMVGKAKFEPHKAEKAGDSLVQISYDGTFDITFDADNPQLEAADLKTTRSAMKASIVFDRNRGQNKSGTIELTLTIEIRPKGADPDSEALIVQTLEQTTKIETLSVERKAEATHKKDK